MIYTEEQQGILEAGVGTDTPTWDLTKLYLLVDPDYPMECWTAYGTLKFLHIDINGWPARMLGTLADAPWFIYRSEN